MRVYLLQTNRRLALNLNCDTQCDPKGRDTRKRIKAFLAREPDRGAWALLMIFIEPCYIFSEFLQIFIMNDHKIGVEGSKQKEEANNEKKTPTVSAELKLILQKLENFQLEENLLIDIMHNSVESCVFSQIKTIYSRSLTRSIWIKIFAHEGTY